VLTGSSADSILQIMCRADSKSTTDWHPIMKNLLRMLLLIPKPQALFEPHPSRDDTKQGTARRRNPRKFLLSKTCTEFWICSCLLAFSAQVIHRSSLELQVSWKRLEQWLQCCQASVGPVPRAQEHLAVGRRLFPRSKSQQRGSGIISAVFWESLSWKQLPS